MGITRYIVFLLVALASLGACGVPSASPTGPEVPPPGVEVQTRGSRVATGDTIQVDVQLYRATQTGTEMIDESHYIYRSTNPGVVAILSLGYALAVGAGVADVVVSASGVEARFPVEVVASGAPGEANPGPALPGEGDRDRAEPVEADIHVHPGDDLVAIVNAAPQGAVIFLQGRPDGSGYTYDIGQRVLTVPNHATIRGPAATRDLLGAIDAPVKIRGAGRQIFNQQNRVGWTIEHLDISGARYVADRNQDGVGINRGTGTVRFVKVHDNDNKGLGGWSGLLEYSELTNNSATRLSGYSAASKSIYVHAVRHSYVHHNHSYGLWTDCDNSGWTVEDNVILDNFASGLFNEISRGPSIIARNRVERNNKGNVQGRAGLVITSSRDVRVIGNTIAGNGLQDVRVWEDKRAGNGAAGCRSGYRTEAIVLTDNIIGSP